jgi:ATP-binding cassette subfamily B protein
MTTIKDETMSTTKAKNNNYNNSNNSNNSNNKMNNEKQKKKLKKEAVKRFLKDELKKELKPLFVGSIAMLCSTVANQAVPNLLGKVLDKSATDASKLLNSNSTSSCNSNSHYNSNYLLLIVLGGGLSSFLRTTMLNRAQDGIASSLRTQVFRSLLLDRDVEWYHLNDDNTDDNTDGNGTVDKKSNTTSSKDDKSKQQTESAPTTSSSSSMSSRSPSAIQSILTKDIETVSSTITTTLANTFRSTCSILFATKNMFHINSNLLSISLSIVPIIGSAAVLLNKFVKKITSQYLTTTQQMEEFATERIDHIATVKTSNREKDEMMKYQQMQNDAKVYSHKASLAKGLFMGFMFSSSSFALVLLFRVGGRSVRSGKMTFGELKTFATYTFMLGLGTSGLMKGLGQIVQGMVCAERVYDLMSLEGESSGSGSGSVNEEHKVEETVTEDEEAKKTMTIENNMVNTISLSNVNFAYASNVSNNVLKDITFSINRGEVIALAGANGSGKSTLASLLVALYKPQSGNVTVSSSSSSVNNTVTEELDFYSFDRKTQSSLVQLVPQQPVMFDTSIRENVTYTNPHATEEEIQKALEASNCTTFVSKLKDGLEYNVGRNGCRLSGGQKQRLALARALLCDPALLILDEPNSSMDAEGDNAVSDAVKNCRSGEGSSSSSSKKRGLLLISHRVTSLELADVIVVLKDGEIVEKGSYNELVENKESALCHLMPDLQ